MTQTNSKQEPNPSPCAAPPTASQPKAKENPALPVVAPDETKSVEEMSPEEQMALYEKDLKENDWGHQPC